MLGKAKIKSKCKGDDISNVLILDTKKIRRVLANSIPVLSSFALMGIMICGISFVDFQILSQEAFAIDQNMCKLSSGGYGYTDPLTGQCIDPNNPGCGAGLAWDAAAQKCYVNKLIEPNLSANASAALVVDDNTTYDTIDANYGSTNYVSHKVTVAANNIESYSLTITGPATISTKDSNGNAVSGATTLNAAGNRTPANMANNSWGYAWSAEGSTDSNLVYQSFTGTAQTLESNSNVSSGQVNLNKKLTFAAKFAEDAKDGHYKASVNLSLITTPQQVVAWNDMVFLQDMSATACSSVSVGTAATLRDFRDGNTYTIARLSDGNCWMTQNLRIVNKTISSTDSDMTSGSFTIPASSTSGFSSYDTANAYYSGNTNYGTYYTWYAATAGTGTQSVSSGDVSNSICPKGWKLPKGGTTTAKNTASSQTGNDFANVFGYTGTDLSSNPNVYTTVGASFGSNALTHGGTSWSAAGRYYDSSPYSVGSDGAYWSRTASGSTGAYGLVFSSGNLGPANGNSRRLGLSVRCVAYSS